MSPDDFLSFIGQHPRPPAIPPHIVPGLVELGLGKPVINEAWNLCFWTGWWGGFIVGALLAAVLFLMLAGVILAVAFLSLWISNRRIDHAATLPTDRARLAALPDYRFGPDPRQAR
jgi:hypothetical protein